MSAAQQQLQTAVINEGLELSYLFRQNAALKNGVPKCTGPQRVDATDDPATPPPSTTTSTTDATTTSTTAVNSATTDSPSPVSGQAADTGKSFARTAAPYLIAAATAAAGAGGTYWWMKPAVQVAAPIVQKANGDIYQYLQSKGFHLPPDQQKQWQTQ